MGEGGVKGILERWITWGCGYSLNLLSQFVGRAELGKKAWGKNQRVRGFDKFCAEKDAKTFEHTQELWIPPFINSRLHFSLPKVDLALFASLLD